MYIEILVLSINLCIFAFMKYKKNIFTGLEVLVVIYVIIFVLVPDFNKPSVTVKDYMGLIIFGEILFDLYNKLKIK